ncbi:MAG TPA: MFS transporter [Rhodocyclaceae bacterium]|nr:MFS transporter [Rhodocyclaceae bacterium]
MNATDPTLHRPAALTSWPAVLAAAFVGVAVAMNVGKVPIAMGQLREEFHLSLVAAGWVSSMFNTLAVFTAVFFGLFGDRLGALRMCFLGLGISILGGIGGLLSPTPELLLLSRFAEGAGFIAAAVSAPALLSAASLPSDRRFALGIWSCYLPAGVGLVTLSAPLLLPMSGWRGLWLLSLLMLLASSFAVYRNRAAYAVRTHITGTQPHFLAVARDALARPLPWILALIFGTWSTQHFALIIWLPTFLKEQRHLSPLLVALLSCLMVLVNVPGNLLGGTLVQRGFRRGNLIATASVITGLSGLGMFVEGLPDLVRYGLCLSLSFWGGLIPSAVISSSATLAKSPNQISTLQGLFSQGAQLGQFLGTPIIAALVAATGHWQSAAWVTGGAATLGIGLGLLVRKLEKAQ